MHSFSGKTVTIFHNGDYSGDFILLEKNSNNEIKIDGEDLFNFLAGYIRTEKIREIENMNLNELIQKG